MRTVKVILTALAIIVLVAGALWRFAVVTPNTGLTPEARAELTETLKH